ncbi:DNA cytosine methyltransferase [Mycoplasmopsis canis]|uniref:DNA cytosine methyltransferase n=1 Tax=Mycoplasmopsis canis TaxID=29555 RepID=UPI00025ACFF4|nr:DNA (cytosine-5-)-methyltransferase [Mycoplasmopsis canis]EIE40964.1 modification methylase BepI-like protein [Mycoplasmopsis canis UF33]
MKIKTKRVLSLFSGVGGMDLGFHGGFKVLKKSVNKELHPEWIEKKEDNWIELKSTIFNTVFVNDINPSAMHAWMNYMNPKDNIYKLESIIDLVKKHNKGVKIFPENIDVITGGFPCQDFSVVGKREGFNSKRSHNNTKDFDQKTENRGQLYLWMKEVVGIVKPLVFIVENVKGLVNLKDAKKIIEKDFSNSANEEYIVIPAKVLQAANYGVPQSRERVFFYGFKKSALNYKAIEALNNLENNDNYNPYPKPTHNFDIRNIKLPSFVTTDDAFIELLEPEKTKDLSQQMYSKAKISKGQGNKEVKSKFVSPTIRSEHHGNIEFRRLKIENGGEKIEEIKKGMKERRLTVRECARLQTFPDDFQFILAKSGEYVPVSVSSAYKIIGNAVPCLLAYNIAKTLEEKWDLYFKKDDFQDKN